MVTGGPMLSGRYQGRQLGSGTQVWRFEEELAAGTITQAECAVAEGAMARSPGHCMTMGTASTMACLAEALGMQLPYSATWPAVDARRDQTAQRAGQRIVELVSDDVRPSAIMTREAFEDAVRVNAAIGGSTNAVIHLAAIAGRLGVPVLPRRRRRAGPRRAHAGRPRALGTLPHGDLCYAGGLPAVMAEIAGLLHLGRPTVAGGTVEDGIADAACWNREVIHPFDRRWRRRGAGRRCCGATWLLTAP